MPVYMKVDGVKADIEYAETEQKDTFVFNTAETRSSDIPFWGDLAYAGNYGDTGSTLTSDQGDGTEGGAVAGIVIAASSDNNHYDGTDGLLFA